jgi:beta-lactamase class D
MRTSFVILTLLLTCLSCSTQKSSEALFNSETSKFKVRDEFKTYFENCGVDGSIVIFDQNNQQWMLSDTTSIHRESLPASTFKIINLLIALETKVIKDENEIVKWVGKTDTVKYGYRPEIYHDMTVQEAFEVSAGWVFIELAKKIGKENYTKYLTECNYGNLNLTQQDADFWNFGNFAISPINQVEFLKNLYNGNLPFSKRNMEIVKRVMLTEETDNYAIHAKTGWTRENNTNTGWWVGYLETNNNTYFFATRLLQNRDNNRDDFGSCRKEITKNVLRDLGFLNRDQLFKKIEHVPIVVTDLDKIKSLLKDQLHFTVKNGRPHAGITNCFVKFQDGTYLEFTQPIDSTQFIGKFYTDFLKARQGGTSLAISITNSEAVQQLFTQQSIPFFVDSSNNSQTIELENSEWFLFEADTTWKEKPANMEHSNTAISLRSTYILCDDLDRDAKKYAGLGFKEIGVGKFSGIPYKLVNIGQSQVYLLDGKKSRKLNERLKVKEMRGICGFEIKVKSLQTFNKGLKESDDVIMEKGKTTIYFQDYNFFIVFTE